MAHIGPLTPFEQRQLDRIQRKLLGEVKPPPGGSLTGRTVVCVWEGSALVRVSASSGLQTPPPRGGGSRGRISGFSSDSRRRMLLLLGKVRRADLGDSLFVTLTYPASWPDDPAAWKGHLRAFGKRLRRKHPDASVIWRLEPQKRGAPHFHLIVFGVGFLPHEWVANAWYEIVGSLDLRHLQAGTETRRIKSARQATYYVSKYCAKVSDLPFSTVDGEWVEHHGRLWGVVNRAAVPFGRLRVVVTHGFDNRERLLNALADASRYDGLRDRKPTESATAYAEVTAAWVASVCSGMQLEDVQDRREALAAFVSSWVDLGAEWVDDDAYPIPPPPESAIIPLSTIQLVLPAGSG